MPQDTNLNVSPYYDDFDENKKFNRVLFKAGIPVQARELTTLQSILQNQIEKFGKHFFKEGSVVIPGSLVYDNEYTCIKIEPTFFGVPVNLYGQELVGLKIRGKTSGVTATVTKFLSEQESIESVVTLYIKYESSSTQDNSSQTFLDGENLVTLSDFTYGNTTFESGSDFAKAIASNANATGSAFSVSSGVWFARGAFIDVDSETIILDQYSTTPSYRVGFYINEEIISAVDDESLYDNAAGFSNYTSPGADRLKISLSLIKKSVDDFQDERFIELIRLDNGQTEKIVEKTLYSELANELARRTYDESGDYYVNEFSLSAKESLNNRYDTFGVFYSGTLTKQGNTPSKDLYALQIGPGKAYVKGYEVETVSNTYVDIAKPRTTETVESVAVPFQAGNLVRVNNVYGGASVGIATTGYVDLRDERLGSDKDSASGQSIGRARVYDYKLSASAYEDDSSRFDLYLFDIQTDTQLTLNSELTISAPALVEGARSGARGFLRSQTGNILTLHQTSGDFLQDESVIVNGVENGRVITKVTEFAIEDIKSVRQEVGIQTFSADTILESRINYGGQSFNISAAVGNKSTVTSINNTWTIGIKTGDIISYNRSGVSEVVYNRVDSIASDAKSIVIEPVESVANVCVGTLPSSAINVSGVNVVSPKLRDSKSGYLYADMPDESIQSVDLTTSDIFVRREYRDRSTDSLGVCDLPSLAGTDFVYTPFDEERYTVIYSNGSIQNLTSDQFELSGGGKGATISGLTASETNIVVTTTQQKSKVTSKSKQLNRCESIVISKSKFDYSGISTGVTDGLEISNVYGLRVQDREISLNVCDVVGVHAIFESSTSGDPIIPSLILTSLNGPSADISDLQIGEVLIGKTSGASAIILGKTGSNEIHIVGKNTNNFEESEDVVFQDSGVTGNITTIKLGDKNIASNFTFDNGQRKEYYDFSRIIRNPGSPVPSKRLKIYFDKLSINSDDSGEILTVNSYNNVEYDRIPSFDGIRNSDVIDIRPRVSDYSGSLSPFEFSSRNFGGSGQSVSNVLVSDENISLDYNYYLGRIDRVFITKDGTFTVIEGVADKNPVEPESIESAFELGKVTYAPYVYEVDRDITFEYRGNKRYTMKDIGKLEDRIENLEYYTSLSLLESKTESLLIQDPDTGLDRFKSGFVVDNFETTQSSDQTVAEFDIANGVMMAPRYFDSVDIVVGSESLVGTNGEPNPQVDLLYADDLGSENIKKTLNAVTLDYSEVNHRVQPFASRVENVNPFTVYDWSGIITLTPEQDVFVERETRGVSGFYGVNNAAFSFETESVITNMRAQNITFNASGLKPNTRHYAYFSDTDMSIERSFIVPKLLEVTPIQGSFIAGETIICRTSRNQNSNRNIRSRFRLCNTNHFAGPFNNPTTRYSLNPYTNTTLPSSYSSTSTVLNVDLASLANKSNQNFFGFVQSGMRLFGQTSGAEAIVSDVRLISDEFGNLQGSLRVPTGDPSFRNGTNTILLTSSSGNDLPGLKVSSANANFYSYGTATTEITIRRQTPPPPPPPPPIPPPIIINNTTVIDNTVTIRETIDRTVTVVQQVERERDDDPLAQSFFVQEPGGIFATSIDLFFATKSESLPVEIRLVPLVDGTPSRKFYAHSIVFKNPVDVNVSSDGSVPTTFTFPRPVYLEEGEHAVVVITDNSDYRCWISRIGEVDIATANASQKVVITKQPTLGSLYKGQNAGVWTPSQLEDLKYTLRRAKFTTQSGSFKFFNPNLDTFNSRNELKSNPIEIFPKKSVIGLSSALTSEFIVIGSEIRQDNNAASGFIEKKLGPIGAANTGLNITNTGVGYSNGTFEGVNFTTLTGSGSGATGIVTVSGGTVDNVCVINTGSGYAVGDTLSATLGSNTLGRNLLFTVGVVTSTNSLSLTKVGSVDFDTSNQIQYVPTSGAGAGIGSTVFGINPITVTTNNNEYDGKHFRVYHDNHGMHAANNLVEISGVEGDTVPTRITVGYGVSSIDNISVASSTNFNFFEGSQVSATNPGFALIGDEIIAYTGVGNNVLTGITTRGIDGTYAKTYPANEPIQKYEISGVSLRKVNTEHQFAIVTNNITDKITLDSYVLRIAGNTVFKDEESIGGENVTASQNVIFDTLKPNIDYTVYDGTALAASVRTVSATSIDSSEVSFQDKGFQSISLDGETRFPDLRMIASKVNEDSKLLGLPGAKSFTLEMNLSTTNQNLSPVIDCFDSTITTRSNRINNPITNYLTDRRTRNEEDPQAFTYVTKIINLDNPAASLKVLAGLYRPSECAVRAYYRLQRADGSEVDKIYEPFPGYDNLDSNGKVIDKKNNSGLPDRNISASTANVFTEYEWSIDNLPQFSAFQIKLVVTSTNQAKSVQMIDFRTIAVA